MKTKRKFTTERAGKEIRNFYESIKDLLFNGKVMGELFNSLGNRVAMVTAIQVEDQHFYALWESDKYEEWSLYYIGDHEKIQQKWDDLYERIN